jgi:hypothetical protein
MIRHTHRRPRRRGTVFLEFAMIMPLFLFLVLFSIDMGRMVLVAGAMNDAAYVSARSGAQLGGAGSPVDGPSRRAFDRAVQSIPGAGADNVDFLIIDGSCTTSQSYITIEASQNVRFITPGLTSLLGMWDGDGRGATEGWELSARGSVLCEIVR